YLDTTGRLADRPLAHGRLARVPRVLRHGSLRRRVLFLQVRLMHPLAEIRGVVIGNVLQGIGDTLDEVVLANHRHARLLRDGWAVAGGEYSGDGRDGQPGGRVTVAAPVPPARRSAALNLQVHHPI